MNRIKVLTEVTQIFRDNLVRCPDSMVDIKDIIKLSEKCGVTVDERSSREDIVDNLYYSRYRSDLVKTFLNSVYVREWIIAQYYEFTVEQINDLYDLGYIKRKPITKQFFSKEKNKYYSTKLYPVGIFYDISMNSVNIARMLEDINSEFYVKKRLKELNGEDRWSNRP